MGSVYHSKGPARIDFGGGGSDAPPFSEEFGGAVVNGAIRKLVFTTLEVRPGTEEIEIVSPEMGMSLHLPSVREIEEDGQLDLVKILIREMGPAFGFRLTIESDLPPGCGLSTSAAVGTATAAVVGLAMGQALTRREMFELSVEVERRILGWPGGSQDQYAAAFGGLNSIEFDGLDAKGRRLELRPEVFWQLEKDLFLCYTGEAHLSSSIHEDIRTAYADPYSPTRGAMQRLKQIAGEMESALEDERLGDFYELLFANWEQHKKLHSSCTNDRLEEFYSVIREHEAAGAKTCGAGGGGCIVVAAPGPGKRALQDALSDIGGQTLAAQFDQEGTVAWENTRSFDGGKNTNGSD